jgi:Ser/Thr protein kinase RdoA (MazF antagonist)
MCASKVPINRWFPISYRTGEFPAKVASDFLVPIEAQRARQLGRDGGLSGAVVWQVTGLQGEYCLRRWPRPHPSEAKLAEIHRCMIHAHQHGLKMVPGLVVPQQGGLALRNCEQLTTYVEAEGHFWEVSQWLSGEADFWEIGNDERLVSACTALGKLHAIWRELAPVGDAKAIGMQIAPAIMDRIWRLQALTDRACEELREGVEKHAGKPWQTSASEILEQIGTLKPTFLAELTYWSRYTYRCQFVLRDIWHDHVLFQGNQCSGLIDYGALRIDTVATDLVRMLGSLLRTGPDESWQIGLAAYQREASLSELELSLLKPLYRSSVLLSGVQWIRWLAMDELTFPGKEGFVKQRIDELAAGAKAIAVAQRSVIG